MHSPFFGEFMGTLVLILMGNGVVAGVLLKSSKAEGAGWVAITAGWAFAVMTGVLTAIACGSAGAHLNPAVTLAVAIKTGDWSSVPAYCIAQLLGAMAGATLVWLHYLPHWALTPDPAAKLGCFSTSPAVLSPPHNFFVEALGTFVLILVVFAIGSKAVNAPFAPPLVGMLVWAIGLSLGGPTGYAINPARDLGPRIAHTILPIAGKKTSNWSYAPVPVAGPLAGAALAGVLVKMVGM
ncbi:MAG TPA: MIP/aquaporin family protein [Candidatus Acidoferrales bacterium]|nr:MIP/aquaporin family protein [Candidatus Acidoferrales bacterium]